MIALFVHAAAHRRRTPHAPAVVVATRAATGVAITSAPTRSADGPARRRPPRQRAEPPSPRRPPRKVDPHQRRRPGSSALFRDAAIDRVRRASPRRRGGRVRRATRQRRRAQPDRQRARARGKDRRGRPAPESGGRVVGRSRTRGARSSIAPATTARSADPPNNQAPPPRGSVRAAPAAQPRWCNSPRHRQSARTAPGESVGRNQRGRRRLRARTRVARRRDCAPRVSRHHADPGEGMGAVLPDASLAARRPSRQWARSQRRDRPTRSSSARTTTSPTRASPTQQPVSFQASFRREGAAWQLVVSALTAAN